MKLNLKYILFIIFLHAIFIALSIPLLQTNKGVFVIAEIFIVISILISIRLYRSYIQPVNLISEAANALREQDFSTTILPVGQKEMDRLVSIYNRMIQQLREEHLKTEEQNFFLNELISASPSGIIILDFNNRITHMNPAAEKIATLKTGQLSGKDIGLVDNDLIKTLARQNADSSGIITINGLQRISYHKAHFIDRSFKHYFIIFEEVTREILATEKQAYGKVIRMMSHEINNSVGAINSILDSVLTNNPNLDDDYTNGLEVARQRNVSLNQFIARFADVVRLPEPHLEETDLHEFLKNISTLMQNQCPDKNIRFHWDLSEKPMTVKIDPQQFEQVAINILKNAIEAIDQSGTITLITESVPAKCVIFRNDGAPISDENQQQLFLPFFSTKQKGQGIGLTITREILHNHGFSYSLKSFPQGYTDFKIIF